MPIRELTEKHKQLAEELLKGTPRAEAARKLGIGRSTVYTWLEDPVFVAYFRELVRDADAARSQRLLPVWNQAIELLSRLLQRSLDALDNPEAEPDNVPNLNTVLTVFEKLNGIARLELGQPGSISERRESEGTKGKRDERIIALLDKLTQPTDSMPGDEAPTAADADEAKPQ